MLSRVQAISQLNAYGVPFSEEKWKCEDTRKNGEFGVFAVIIRVIAGLFILGMVSISIAGFIALIGLEESWQTVTGIIGILATGLAAWKFRHSYSALEKQYSFRGLLYLSLLLVGKACLLVALYGWLDTWPYGADGGWMVALIFSAITVVSCLYYRMYLEIILAVLVSFFLLDTALASNLASVAHQIAIVALVFCMAVLIWRQKIHNLSSVFLYATMLFLAYKLLPYWGNAVLLFSQSELPDPSISTALVVIVAFAATFALYVFLVGGWQKLKSVQHMVVVVSIALLAAFSVHGVLLAVSLMALGHMRHDRVFWVIGIIYLPLYLFAFYYTLDATLLIKSYMLIGSGIAILAARYVFVRFGAQSSGETDHA